MTHLQEQLDELELLESMFSSPGEFEIEDKVAHAQAEAFLRQLTLNAPRPKSLTCKLFIPINAHQDSDDEGENDCSSATEGKAEIEQLVSYSINISVRLVPR